MNQSSASVQKTDVQTPDPPTPVGMHHGASTYAQTPDPPTPVRMHHGASSSAQTPERTVVHGKFDGFLRYNRKNIRADFHDYSGGEYFITICTRNKDHFFGTIYDGKMHLTSIGKFAHDALESLHEHYRYVDVPLFIVMPNHVHAIIYIIKPTETPTKRSALSVAVGGFKQSVTMFARRNGIEFGWQKRFHDRIIRNIGEGKTITEYIKNNISRWDSDCYYGKYSQLT